MNAMTVSTLTGQRVTLRAIQPEDEHARLTLGWHAAIQRNYGQLVQTREMTPAEARAWYEQQQARGADPSRRYWAIEAEGHMVGGAGLDSLKETDRKAHFVIGMFSPSQMGRGLGTEATRLLLDHAFRSMNLHRVDLRVLAFNDGAIACRSYRRGSPVNTSRATWLPSESLVRGVVMKLIQSPGTRIRKSTMPKARLSSGPGSPAKVRRSHRDRLTTIARRRGAPWRPALQPWDVPVEHFGVVAP